MDVFLTPIGSAGDVHPFVALGVELARRGHRVTVAVNGYFEETVRRSGLAFAPLGTREDFIRVLHHPALWNPLRALPFLMREGALPALRPLYGFLKANADPRRSVVVSSVLAFGARVARESLGLPLVSVHLQPSIFRSATAPPAPIPPWLPAPLTRGLFGLFDFVVDAVAGPGLNAFRAELGLPPVRGVADRWWHSPDQIVAFFPAWFAPPPADWPEVVFAGFPLFDDAAAGAPPALEDFLSSGPAPVVFTAGSANAQAETFFSASVEACRRGSFRGLLLTRFPELVPRDLPPTVRHFPYVPFSRVLPRAAALVHHGGIGTTAQALAAGTPQLVVPLAHDQFDNGARVERLGVGRVLSRGSYGPRRAAAVLEGLLSDGGVRAACRAAAGRMDGAAAVARAADAVEETARGNG